MSYEIAIKVGPVATHERLSDPDWAQPGRTLYWSDCLQITKPPALLVDHDVERRLGTIDKVYALDCGDGPWLVACGTVTVEPPSWLRPGTAASFSCYPSYRSEYYADVIGRALLDEVSVLETLAPAEPAARVLLLKRTAPATPRRASILHDRPGVIIRPGIGRVLGVR